MPGILGWIGNGQQRARCIAGCTSCSGTLRVTQLVQDSIVGLPHYRERHPTREYPPDAVTRGGGRKRTMADAPHESCFMGPTMNR